MTPQTLISALRELATRHEEFVPALPPQKQRAAAAQMRTSLRRLFGVESVSELAENTVFREQPIPEMAVEVWRFLRAHERAVLALPPEKRENVSPKARTESAFCDILRPLLEILAGNGIRLVVYEDVDYEPGYPVDAVNAEEMGDSDDLVMSETLEPVLMRDGKVLRFGRVFLARKEMSDASGN